MSYLLLLYVFLSECTVKWAHVEAISVCATGKSALHWAAAVNNVDAAMVLLKNGANKDMQNNKVSSTWFFKSQITLSVIEDIRVILRLTS